VDVTKERIVVDQPVDWVARHVLAAVGEADASIDGRHERRPVRPLLLPRQERVKDAVE